MSEEKDNILEWYSQIDENQQDEAVVVSYADNPDYDDGGSEESGQETSDESPSGFDVHNKADEVLQKDKMNCYKAYGLSRIINEKLQYYGQMLISQETDYMEKQKLAKDIQDLVNELSQYTAEL